MLLNSAFDKSALLIKSDLNIATEIKAPAGSIYEKYVCISFIVKINSKFGSFGSF